LSRINRAQRDEAAWKGNSGERGRNRTFNLLIKSSRSTDYQQLTTIAASCYKWR
jgi:hypothetical protein